MRAYYTVKPLKNKRAEHSIKDPASLLIRHAALCIMRIKKAKAPHYFTLKA